MSKLQLETIGLCQVFCVNNKFRNAEFKDEEFNKAKTKIALYISCWLKQDWDRFHNEIYPNYKKDYEEKYIAAMRTINGL